MAYIQDWGMRVQAQPQINTTRRAFLHLSQNENGRMLNIRITDVNIPAGSTAVLAGTKPDGTVYSQAGTLSGNTATFAEDVQMTAVVGTWDAKITVTNGGNCICTARITITIDPDTVAGGAVPSDSQLDGIIAECRAIADSVRKEAYGSPLVADAVEDMTDQSRVYVYTGSESGMTAGHWYYYNGSTWADGGVYNAVAVDTDTTLSIAGKAADAKEVGDQLTSVKEDLNDKLSPIKQGENVALTIEDGCIRKTLTVYTHANYYHANVPVQEGETYRVSCYSINSSDYPGVFAIVNGTPTVILGGTSTKYNGTVFTIPSGVTNIYINTISTVVPIELFKITTSVTIYSTPKMYVALYNDAPKTAKVCYKIGNNDLVVTFGKNNANDLPDFMRFDAVENNTPEVGVALYGTNLTKITTDFFSPYVVRAVNNIDGDMPSGYSDDFTGGAHEYTNTGTDGTPTARCSNLEYYVDGRKVDEYCGYANDFRAKWTNLIQGNNTKKADGTGREILKEIHDMRFDGISWNVDVEIVPLEDVVIERWYGLQIRHKGTSGTLVKYVGADNRQEYAGNVDSNSGARLTSGIIVDGDTYLPTTINVDVSVDLGKRVFYSGSRGAFTVGASKKTYFNIIENLSALRGDHYFMRGSYRFDLP